MAERKVSGKQKNNTTKASASNASAHILQQSEYDAFIAQYGPNLRRRNTAVVPEPKRTRMRAEEVNAARCGEIDPHLAVNPAAEHQIFTKRTGRILSDDTGFKAMNYNDRFELKPEMPQFDASESIVAQGGFDDTAVPGQQTMADLVSVSDSDVEIAVPVEAKINNEENAFELAYKAMRNEAGMTFGKSEKLRAIARTAADDAGMAPDSQLAFPAFLPLFKFPEEEKPKRSKVKKKNKKTKSAKQQPTVFDIDESEIVTSHSIEIPQDDDSSETVASDSLDKKHRAKRIFETISNEGLQDAEPDFEMSTKADVVSTIRKVKKMRLTEIIKTACLLLFCVVLGIISLVAAAPQSTVNFAAVSIIFIVLSGVVCIKELIGGIKDILKLKFSYNFGAVLIFVVSLLQSIIGAFAASDGTVHILSVSAIFVLIFITVPKILLSDNAQTAVNIFASGSSVSLFKPLSESGIEGSVQAKYANKDNDIRFSVKTEFVTGLMKKLTNAIPKPFAGNIMFAFAFVFAIIIGIASGIKSGSFIGAVTGFDAVLICCIPMIYTLCAASLLFASNKKLAKSRSSIISYKSASELTRTKAVVLDDCDIIEASSCSIHGVKFFGSTEPKEASLCCAAVMNSADMPLFEIMKKVIEQSEDEIPEADDYILSDKGVAAIYDSNKILLGTKEFLTENHVYVPQENFEEKYITGDRKLLYLSVNGEFSMLLIVSYHVRRSVSKFIKYLAKKNIDIIVHSCDPNITADYIAGKCKVQMNSVARLNETETAYFKAKKSKTETALPAEIFTDGKTASLFAMFKNAFYLASSANALPMIIFAVSVVSLAAVAVPVMLGSIQMLNNAYIVLVKLISSAIGIAVPMIIYKEK